jgi:hypothetical protein
MPEIQLKNQYCCASFYFPPDSKVDEFRKKVRLLLFGKWRQSGYGLLHILNGPGPALNFEINLATSCFPYGHVGCPSGCFFSIPDRRCGLSKTVNGLTDITGIYVSNPTEEFSVCCGVGDITGSMQNQIDFILISSDVQLSDPPRHPFSLPR